MITVCKHDNIPPCPDCIASKEPDPVAVDLISRLTKAYSESLWRHEKGMCEYTSDRQYCASCLAVKGVSDYPVHNDGCIGVKLIIDSLMYIGKHAD